MSSSALRVDSGASFTQSARAARPESQELSATAPRSRTWCSMLAELPGGAFGSIIAWLSARSEPARWFTKSRLSAMVCGGRSTPTVHALRDLAEARRALLEERLHRLGVLGALPARAQHLALAALHLVEVGRRGVLGEQPLRHAELWVRVGGALARQLRRRVEELLGLGQAVGEPARRRLRAAVEPSREAHLARLAEAHALDEEVRARQLWDEADLDEEHPEARLLRGDDHVEGQDHGHADADRGAVDGGNERLRLAHQTHPVEAGRHAALAARRVLPGIAPLDAGLEGELHVGAGAERAPGAGHDDRADRAIVVRPPDGVRLFDGHLGRPGVQLLGTVEGDLRDPVAGLVADELVRHALSLAHLPSPRVTSPLPIVLSWGLDQCGHSGDRELRSPVSDRKSTSPARPTPARSAARARTRFAS